MQVSPSHDTILSTTEDLSLSTDILAYSAQGMLSLLLSGKGRATQTLHTDSSHGKVEGEGLRASRVHLHIRKAPLPSTSELQSQGHAGLPLGMSPLVPR